MRRCSSSRRTKQHWEERKQDHARRPFLRCRRLFAHDQPAFSRFMLVETKGTPIQWAVFLPSRLVSSTLHARGRDQLSPFRRFKPLLPHLVCRLAAGRRLLQQNSLLLYYHFPLSSASLSRVALQSSVDCEVCDVRFCRSSVSFPHANCFFSAPQHARFTSHVP